MPPRCFIPTQPDNLLKEPARVRAGLDAMIEQEREGLRGDLDSEVKVWLDKLAEADEKRRGYQRLAAKGLMTDDELDKALVELDETHETARRELQSLAQRRENNRTGARQGRPT